MYLRLFQGTPFEVASWNFFFSIGFLVVTLLIILKRPKDFPVSRLGLGVLSVLMLYFGLIGAKILYIFLHWNMITQSNLTVFLALKVAGYALLGAMIAIVLTIFLFTKLRVRRISFLKVADYIIPFIVLQLAFVRIGCFLNGCCYGKQTVLPWGCTFQSVPPVSHHPTQIYSMLALLLNFIIMRHVYKRNLPGGVVLFGSLFIYGFLRFFIEFLRVDSYEVVGAITLAQVAMFGVAAISAFSLLVIFGKKTLPGK